MQSSSRWVRMRDLRWQSCCRQHKENYCRQCHTKLPHKFCHVLPVVSEFLACAGRPCAHLIWSSIPNRKSHACMQAQQEANKWLEVLHLAVCRCCCHCVHLEEHLYICDSYRYERYSAEHGIYGTSPVGNLTQPQQQKGKLFSHSYKDVSCFFPAAIKISCVLWLRRGSTWLVWESASLFSSCSLSQEGNHTFPLPLYTPKQFMPWPAQQQKGVLCTWAPIQLLELPLNYLPNDFSQKGSSETRS